MNTLAIDPFTHRFRRGSLTIERDGSIEIRLPFRLESPNALLHAHWRVRTRDKEAWRARLLTTIADAARVKTVAALDRPLAALGIGPVHARRRVWV